MQTQAEQRAMLLRFWRQYGRFLLVAVAFGLLLGYGWRYYQSSQQKRLAAASMLFQQVVDAPLTSHLPPADPAVSAAQALFTHYGDLNYAGMSGLWLAKNEVLAKHWQPAIQYLQKVVKQSKSPIIRQIARMRAARIMLQQQQYAAAMKQLARLEDVAYQPQVSELRGDIWMAQKKWKAAQQSYRTAQSGFKKIDVDAPGLDDKLAQLALHLPAS